MQTSLQNGSEIGAVVDVLDMVYGKTLTSINALHETWRQLLPLVSLQSVSSDFAFLSASLGNDYIPKIPGTALSSLWEVYQQMRLEGKGPLYDTDQKAVNGPLFLELLFPPYLSLCPTSVPLGFLRLNLLPLIFIIIYTYMYVTLRSPSLVS